jgi:hypothetical protein
VGDVVLIRSHRSPLAMVRVTDECYPNENKDLWFEIIRKIEIVAIDESGTIKTEYKNASGQNWTEGIYAPTTFEIANNWHFLKYWYTKITRERLMENVKFSDKRKAEN